MNFDFAPLAWVYFSIGAAALGLTILARNPALIFGALVMLASWLASNEVLKASGWAALIGHDAVICAVLAACVAVVGQASRNRALAVVFGLFVVNVALDLGFLATIGASHLIVTRGVSLWYATGVNILFVGQCLALGGASVGTRLGHSPPARAGVPDRARKHRGSVVARVARE